MNFKDPYDFHPERWLPKTHAEYDPAFETDQKDASKPFSLGPRGCLGINLAYIEMRMILSKLVWHFDWEWLNKDLDWTNETMAWFLWKKPAIMVKFTPARP